MQSADHVYLRNSKRESLTPGGDDFGGSELKSMRITLFRCEGDEMAGGKPNVRVICVASQD